MLAITVAAALQAAAPAPEPTLEVGIFEPREFPELRLRERRLPWAAMHDRVEDLMRQRRCSFEGQNLRRYDIRVPYVVQVEPNGGVSRIVVADVGCPPLETYVGTMVRELARAGDFRITAAAEPLWYSSEARFTVQ